MSTVITHNLIAPITTLSGVGPAVAAKLARLGIRTVRDLIFYWPRTWLDMSVLTPIGSARAEQYVVIQGTLHGIELERRKGNRLVRVNATVRDETGAELAVLWFNQAYLAQSLIEGKQYLLAGTVKWDWHRKRLYLASPTRETELGVVAVYSETEGLTSRYLRNLIAPLLSDLDLPDPLATTKSSSILPESSSGQALFPKEEAPVFPSLGKEGLGEIYAGSDALMSLTQAVSSVHKPTTLAEAMAAKQRLAYDEHLLLQLGLAELRQSQLATLAPSIQPSIDALKQLVAALPFTLTDAQRRAAWDLIQHLQNGYQTHQLLQGDVGSGKTVVGLLVALSVLEAGYHVTWMVPTQILARQLHERIGQLLGKTKHEATLVMQGESIATPSQPTFFVGTHALLNQTFDDRPTGLVVIDEQQRFGVAQREAAKFSAHQLQPHVLTMTATPIPRSLALAILDEQSLVTLKGKPTHQLPIVTKRARSRTEVIEHLSAAAQRGEQAFVVVPRITGVSDQLFTQSIDHVAATYRKAIPGIELAVLHGQQGSDEQATILEKFTKGEIAILVATTVVEVGVDVPNATVMVIEEAENFGLAQLHQLRGRIGRGKAQGYCYLLSDVSDEQAVARLDALVASNDGFELAQKDLELRGPGELLGTIQSGLPQLKLASLDDTLVVQQARNQVDAWLKDPPKDLEAWRKLYRSDVA